MSGRLWLCHLMQQKNVYDKNKKTFQAYKNGFELDLRSWLYPFDKEKFFNENLNSLR